MWAGCQAQDEEIMNAALYLPPNKSNIQAAFLSFRQTSLQPPGLCTCCSLCSALCLPGPLCFPHLHGCPFSFSRLGVTSQKSPQAGLPPHAPHPATFFILFSRHFLTLFIVTGIYSLFSLCSWNGSLYNQEPVQFISNHVPCSTTYHSYGKVV